MPPVYYRIGIKNYRVLGCEAKDGPQFLVRPHQNLRPKACLHCGSPRLRSKGRYWRRVRHLEVCGRQSTLLIQAQRLRCGQCQRSFVQPLPGIIKGRHSSEPLRELLYKQHHHGLCASSMARLHRISAATIGRIYAQFTQRKAAERLSRQAPIVLGLDEHRAPCPGGFATTLVDLKNHRVFDVVPGRSGTALAAFLGSLRGRDKVRVVCIDLSSPYRSLVRRFFPKAILVADRFHVVRLASHHFLELAKQLVPALRQRRSSHALLRKRPQRLTPAQAERLRLLLAEHPVLEPLHQRLHQLHRLLCFKHRTRRQCSRLLRVLLRFMALLEQSQFPAMLTLSSTFRSWLAEIAAMWRFTKSNGITEGFHRKMKLIQRRAYGFRNFQNYRLRVIAQCG